MSIELCHKWTLTICDYKMKKPFTFTSNFHDDKIPDADFTIYICIDIDRKLNITLRKTSIDLAIATIKITLGGTLKTSINVNGWGSYCSPPGISIPKSFFQRRNLNLDGTCDIAWRGYVKNMRKLTSSNLYDYMQDFFMTNQFTDMIIKINNDEIPVHKVVLASQSAVFFTMFNADMSESKNNELIINDIDINTMKRVIEFLYTGQIDLTLDFERLLSILSVANKYAMEHLKDFATHILIDKLTVCNIFAILQVAELHNNRKLTEAIMSFMVDNRGKIETNSSNFKDLVVSNPDFVSKYIQKINQELNDTNSKDNILKITPHVTFNNRYLHGNK